MIDDSGPKLRRQEWHCIGIGQDMYLTCGVGIYIQSISSCRAAPAQSTLKWKTFTCVARRDGVAIEQLSGAAEVCVAGNVKNWKTCVAYNVHGVLFALQLHCVDRVVGPSGLDSDFTQERPVLLALIVCNSTSCITDPCCKDTDRSLEPLREYSAARAGKSLNICSNSNQL